MRINALATEWGAADLAAAAAAGPDAILVPKVDTAADIARVAAAMEAAGAPDRTTIWAMMETPLGILNAARHRRGASPARGLRAGHQRPGQGARRGADARPGAAFTSLGLAVLAARAYGLVCVDGVYNAFQDDEGFTAACVQGRDLGFDGKTLIHPRQLADRQRGLRAVAGDLELASAAGRCLRGGRRRAARAWRC